MAARFYWSDEIVARMRELLEKGERRELIAKSLGVSRRSLDRRIEFYGTDCNPPGYKPQCPWTADQDARLRELISQRAGYTRIAQEFDISRAAVASRVRKLGIAVPRQNPRPFGEEEEKILRKLVAQGSTLHTIAITMGRSRHSCFRHIERLDIELADDLKDETRERRAAVKGSAKLLARLKKHHPKDDPERANDRTKSVGTITEIRASGTPERVGHPQDGREQARLPARDSQMAHP